MNKYFYDLLLLITAILWGSGFIAADIAIEYWPPILITALRFSIAATCFFLIGIKTLKNITNYMLPGLVLGFLLAMGFIFQTVALNYTTPAKNAFLTATNVVITPFLGLIFNRQKKISIQVFVGAVLALLGIGILNLDNQSLWINNTGDTLTLICAVFFALHIYYTGQFLQEKGYHLNSLVFLQLFFAALISLLAAVLFEDIHIQTFFSTPGYAVIYLGLLPTLLCYFLQNFAQRRVNSNKTAVILSTEALFGTLFSVLMRNEILTNIMLIGFLVLFSSILIIEVKIPTKQK